MPELFSDKRRIFDGNIAEPVVTDRQIAIPSRDFNCCDIHFRSIKGAASADIDPVIAAVFSIENKPINQPQTAPFRMVADCISSMIMSASSLTSCPGAPYTTILTPPKFVLVVVEEVRG